MILSNKRVFNGLTSVSMNSIKNITKYYQNMLIVIEFSFNFFLIYNASIPIITDQIQDIQQVQQSLLSQCIFNSTVKIKSVSAPLILFTDLKLKTDGLRKKRQIGYSNCENQKETFSSICSNLTKLTNCRMVELNEFLTTFINQTVKPESIC